ncbi:hypothetical protein BC835DRAFT_428410 [Cytidiella melzeri]|nr:hypothetical protein BC835DRAFT_428410 [Cytidiella melzeri]
MRVFGPGPKLYKYPRVIPALLNLLPPPVCNIAFVEYQAQRLLHMSTYNCERCDKQFSELVHLRQHKRMARAHAGLYCDKCNKDFDAKQSLTQHYVQSPLHAYCQFCEVHFDDKTKLVGHYNEKHGYCKLCNKAFATEKGLHAHSKQVHHCCEECQRAFKTENNLKMHLASSTHDPRTVSCGGCDKSFISRADLVLHFETATCSSGATRFKVNEAMLIADERNVLINSKCRGEIRRDEPAQADESARNGDEYECSLCHNTFSTLPGLNAHLHSPVHDAEIYQCPAAYKGCGKGFKTCSAVLSHIDRSGCGVKKSKLQRVLGSLIERIQSLFVQA